MSPRVSRRDVLRGAGRIALALAVPPVLQACGSGGDAQDANTDNAMVEMNDEMRFEPASLTIRAGQAVTWRNVGSMVHTSTCDPRSAQRPEHAVLPDGAAPWDSGLVRAGESWSLTFDTPGTYAYFCVPHEAAGMVGSLVVEA